jgi:hypothetical protein
MFSQSLLTSRRAFTAKLASTANITLPGSPISVDGVTVSVGDVILVKDQTAPAENGLYTVAPGTWVRTSFADSAHELRGGTIVSVAQGATNAGTTWTLTTSDDPPIVGTSVLTFKRVVSFVTTGANGDIAFVSAGALSSTGALNWNGTTFAVTSNFSQGSGTFTVSPTGASLIAGSGTLSVSGTPLTLTSVGAASWGTSSGLLSINAGGGSQLVLGNGTTDVQIGSGVGGSTTVQGTFNKMSNGTFSLDSNGPASIQTSAISSPLTISTTGTSSALNLASNQTGFSLSGATASTIQTTAGGLSLTGGTGALNLGTTSTEGVNLGRSAKANVITGSTTGVTGPLTQSGGALSLTPNAASIISTSNGKLELQATGVAAGVEISAASSTSTSFLKGPAGATVQVDAGTVSLGTGVASTVNIGKAGVTMGLTGSTIGLNGATTVTGGLSQSTGAVNLTANGASQLTTSVGNLTLKEAAAATILIGQPYATSDITAAISITDGKVGVGSTTASDVRLLAFHKVDGTTALRAQHNGNATSNIAEFSTTGNAQRVTINQTGATTITMGSGTTTRPLHIKPASAVETSGLVYLSYPGVPSTVTQTGHILGFTSDLSSNLINSGTNVFNQTAFQAFLGATTNTGSNLAFMSGLNVNGGALTTSTSAAANINWRGVNIAMPNLTRSNGTLTSAGVRVGNGTASGSVSQHMVHIDASGVASGTLNGIFVGNIVGGAGTETGLNIGSGWDAGISCASPATFTGAINCNGDFTHNGTGDFNLEDNSFKNSQPILSGVMVRRVGLLGRTNHTTPAADPELILPVLGGLRYRFRYFLHVKAWSSEDIKLLITGPSSSALHYAIWAVNRSEAPIIETFFSQSNNILLFPGVDNIVIVEGTVLINTSGNLGINWGTVGTGQIDMQFGSYIEATVITS